MKITDFWHFLTTYVRELSIKGFTMWYVWDVLYLKLGLT